jgi:hypothetical protein
MKPKTNPPGTDTNTTSGADNNIIELKTSKTGASNINLDNHTTDNQAHVKSAKKMDKTGADTGADPEQVHIGRPKDSKDKQVRKKRTDFNITQQVPQDDKQLILKHNVELWQLGKLKDKNNVEEVRERIATYFTLCQQNVQMPTVAGLALAFGIDRTTLWTWVDNRTGVIKNPEVLDTLKQVYNLIGSQYEGLLTQGKIVPVAGFFLLQNNFGYKNTTDHVVSVQQQEEPSADDIAARAGLLEDK